MCAKKSSKVDPKNTAKAEIQKLQIAPVTTVIIRDDKDYESNRELYKNLKGRLKTLKERQDAILAPMKKSMQEVKALFGPPMTRLEEACEVIQESLSKFANRRLEERQAELERINNDNRLKKPETIQRLRSEVDHLVEGTMKVKKLAIVTLDIIPGEYWILDEVKLRKDLMAGKDVPGATLVEELTVTSR